MHQFFRYISNISMSFEIGIPVFWDNKNHLTRELTEEFNTIVEGISYFY